MKSTKTTESYVKCVRYYIIRRKLLHYQARGVYYIIRRKLLHYQAASLLHYQAMLLHYKAVITLSGFLLHYQAVITLTGDYYIIGSNSRHLAVATTLHSASHPHLIWRLYSNKDDSYTSTENSRWIACLVDVLQCYVYQHSTVHGVYTLVEVLFSIRKHARSPSP